MSVPSHSSDCVTKIFPSKCPYCGKRVLFFSCSCGSKVYFEEGICPFKDHREYCVASIIIDLMQNKQLSLNTIKMKINDYAYEHHLEIPSNVKRLLNRK